MCYTFSLSTAVSLFLETLICPHCSSPFRCVLLVQFRHLSMVTPTYPHCSSPCGCLCLLQFIHLNLITPISPHCSSSPCTCHCFSAIHTFELGKRTTAFGLTATRHWVDRLGWVLHCIRSWSQCCIDVLLRLVYVGTKL